MLEYAPPLEPRASHLARPSNRARVITLDENVLMMITINFDTSENRIKAHKEIASDYNGSCTQIITLHIFVRSVVPA